MILETIEKENDIKNVAPENLNLLAEEIREFLIRKISVTGGHLGSNLGAVELTMALQPEPSKRQNRVGCRAPVLYAQTAYGQKIWI